MIFELFMWLSSQNNLVFPLIDTLKGWLIGWDNFYEIINLNID